MLFPIEFIKLREGLAAYKIDYQIYLKKTSGQCCGKKSLFQTFLNEGKNLSQKREKILKREDEFFWSQFG